MTILERRWRKELKRKRERRVQRQMYREGQVAQYNLHKKLIRERQHDQWAHAQ